MTKRKFGFPPKAKEPTPPAVTTATKEEAAERAARVLERRVERERAARASLAAWTRKLRFASNKVAKYQKQVAYYEALVALAKKGG